MTTRECTLTALSHKQPARVPYCVHFTQKAHQAMAAYYGVPVFEKKLGNCLIFPGSDVANGWSRVAPNVDQDPFGVQWDRSVDKDIGVVCNRVVTPETIDTCPLPDPCASYLFSKFASTIAARPDGVIMANLGFSLFERAWTMAGMEEVLIWMAAEPALAHRLLDRILEYNLRYIDKACSFAIDAMSIGDDWGQQRGLIMGPHLWREFIKPRVRAMYQRIKAHGKFVMIHSCGMVQELFPDLIECGVDVFNPFQPEVMDVAEMKKRFGDRLSFFGGISTQQTLPFGTPAQTREEVRRLLDVVGKNGGYIAAPAHSVPADARPENIAAMLDVLQNQ